MKMIEWPTSSSPSRTETSTPILLPELDLTDADYEAAGEALRKLEGCFFEVVFVHEVAARHCRERQLAAEISRNHAMPPSEQAQARDFIERWKKPTPLRRLSSFGQRDVKLNRKKH